MKKYRLIKQTNNNGWIEDDGTPMKNDRIISEDEILNGHPFSYWYKNQERYFEEVVENKSTEPLDAINPTHYKKGKVECIDALEAATVNKTGIEAICTSNIIKYLWRYESKNGITDVKKAQWYLKKLINHLER